MKKLSFIIILTAITVFTVGAQSSTEHGNTQLNAGVGFSGWGIPIYVGFDFGVRHDMTLGLQASFRRYDQDYQHIYYNHTILGFSGNGNYHFNRILNIPSNWDFYAGLNIGFYFWSSPTDYPGTGSSSVGLGAQVGGRYFFSDRFGLNLEVGGNSTWNSGGKFGITYRF
jgi:outer membrane immunogenic protein